MLESISKVTGAEKQNWDVSVPICHPALENRKTVWKWLWQHKWMFERIIKITGAEKQNRDICVPIYYPYLKEQENCEKVIKTT